MSSIPLVGKGQNNTSASPYLRSSFNVLSNLRNSNVDGSTLRIRSAGDGAESDAIKKELSEEPLTAEEINERDDRGIRIGGYLGSALRELGRIAKRLEELQERIDSETNDERKLLLETEKATLTGEVDRIVTSDNFQEAITAANNIVSVLQNGQISRRSLSGANALLGDQFLDLAASGAIGAISTLSRGLEQLQGFDAESFVDSPSRPSSLTNLARELTKALQTRTSSQAETREVESKEQVTFVEAPEFSETSFQAAGDIALSLRIEAGRV